MTTIEPRIYQAIAIKNGIKLLKIGMKANRDYTLKNCRMMAEKITGQEFKARDYDGMIAALEQWIEEQCREK